MNNIHLRFMNNIVDELIYWTRFYQELIDDMQHDAYTKVYNKSMLVYNLDVADGAFTEEFVTAMAMIEYYKWRRSQNMGGS